MASISPQTVAELFLSLTTSDRATVMQLIDCNREEETKEMTLLELAEPENIEHLILWIKKTERIQHPKRAQTAQIMPAS